MKPNWKQRLKKAPNCSNLCNSMSFIRWANHHLY